MELFGDLYAGAYDQLYEGKDYDEECDIVETFLGLAHDKKKAIILDLGCGTAGHAIRLAQRGHTIVGVDVSGAMLLRGRQKVEDAGLKDAISLHQADIRTLQLDGPRFDAAIMMFAVLGYQKTDVDVCNCLRSVRKHLRKGGYFVFDIWYGPAVLALRPGPRELIVDKDGKRIVRRTAAILDEEHHLCAVLFDLSITQDGLQNANTHEEHVVRFFFPDELSRFASECGFATVSLRGFPAWGAPPTSSSWNAVAVWQAV